MREGPSASRSPPRRIRIAVEAFDAPSAPGLVPERRRLPLVAQAVGCKERMASGRMQMAGQVHRSIRIWSVSRVLQDAITLQQLQFELTRWPRRPNLRAARLCASACGCSQYIGRETSGRKSACLGRLKA
jgi:hypothetical protein